jgi:hypothetical protein
VHVAAVEDFFGATEALAGDAGETEEAGGAGFTALAAAVGPFLGASEAFREEASSTNFVLTPLTPLPARALFPAWPPFSREPVMGCIGDWTRERFRLFLGFLLLREELLAAGAGGFVLFTLAVMRTGDGLSLLRAQLLAAFGGAFPASSIVASFCCRSRGKASSARCWSVAAAAAAALGLRHQG